MKNKKLIRLGWVTVSLLLLAAMRSDAQTDPHFTQNYTFPMYINPALTGSSDGDYRVSAIYRSQWGGISNPYRTMGVSFDKRTNRNIAVGGNILNQSAGDGGFNYFNAYASVAYTGVKLGTVNNHRIVFAMQVGIINRSVNASKFK
jgi:type IX secretion system PorP/SprF family membrane protein